MNDRLDFILTMIKQDYNTNDQLKFILSFIRRDNGLNKWLKHVKRGYGKQTKNELKDSISGTYRLKTEERTKNDEE